jgi:bacteriocin biosynthesis cyclodehydratase domain-containing protein
VLSAAGDGGATREEIAGLFAAPDRPGVERLVDHLVSRRLLVPAGEAPAAADDESNLDVFYWHFDRRREEVQRDLGHRRILLVGVNELSRRCGEALADAGLGCAAVVDDPPLGNPALTEGRNGTGGARWPDRLPRPVAVEAWRETFDPAGVDCLIATAEFGGQHLLRRWNAFCVDRELRFLPVLLQDLVGSIGPLVIPGETACLECLRARQNSHLEDPASQRAAELRAEEGRKTVAFHPLMVSVLGEVAAFELLKYFAGIPEWRVGCLLEMSLLAGSLRSRRVLKVPRCAVCSPLNRRSSVTPRGVPLVLSNRP